MATTTKKKADRITDYIRNNPKLDPEIYRIAARLAVESKQCLAGCSLIFDALREKYISTRRSDVGLITYSKLLAMLFCDNNKETSAYLTFQSNAFGGLTNAITTWYANSFYSKEEELFSEIKEKSKYLDLFSKPIKEQRYGKEIMSFRTRLHEANNEYIVLRNAISRDYRAFALLFTAEVLEDELKQLKKSNVKKTLKSPTRTTTKRKRSRK